MSNINWKELLKGFLYMFICFFIFPIVISCFLNFFPSDDTSYVYIANSIYYLLIVLFLIFIYHKSLLEDFKKFKKNWKKNFALAFKRWLEAFIFMFLTNAIILQFIGSMSQNEEANRTIMQAYPIFSIISMAFMGPFFEEMLFRKGFKNAFKKESYFIIFTSILFGFAHITISFNFSSLEAIVAGLKNCLYIIPYSGIGYFFAKAYTETDTIFTTIFMHILHNSITLIIIMLGSMAL